MIKSLDITNFQSHNDSHLEFSDGVNIIVGSSDSGKTAIIRALRWLMFNKPSGDEMRSHWGGKTSVEIFTDDAHIVKNKDKQQEYILGDTHFTAFGTDVPEEIVKALNVTDINIQNQLDSPFLLSETPGAVAQHFNKVARLDKIDKATSNINSWIRELTSDIKYTEGQEKVLQEGLEKFEHLEKFESEVEVLEEENRRLTSIQNKYDKLLKLCTEYQEVRTTIDVESELFQFEQPLEDIFKWKDQIENIGTDAGELQHLVKWIKETQDEINEKSELLSLEKPLETVLGLYEELNTLKTKQTSLSKLLSSINRINGQLEDKKALQERLHAKFEKEMGDTCLLCGQKIKR